MPPQLLYDISGIDLNRVVFDQEAIRQCNPQRGDMEQLNAIVYAEGLPKSKLARDYFFRLPTARRPPLTAL